MTVRRLSFLKLAFRILGVAGGLCAFGLDAEPASTALKEVQRQEQAHDHWSFLPLVRPQVPSGIHPVDAYIQSFLKEKGLDPNPPAEPRELVRRIYFDMLGLPPTPEEMDAYEKDASPDRYEKLVERLLASPRYGERWARHWLDVVRYTESQGFEYDRLRDNAWPYRDYVIRSLNADKPYDQFMREQLAGDVLEPVTRDGILGASLLVSGPWDQAGNSQANATQRAVTREEEMEDLVSVVGQTFLGLTINCARCHDHKFDPISLGDYYRVKAVFDGVRHGERSVESPAELQVRTDQRNRCQREISEAQAVLDELDAEGSKKASAAMASGPQEIGPRAFLRWDFESTANVHQPVELKGGAVVNGGRLRLSQPGAFLQTPPLSKDIREKTLEAWVSLSDLEQKGGAALTIESGDGSKFDAIVFAELQPRKWAAGSDGLNRTRTLEAPEESSGPGTLIHMVAVYGTDNGIQLYRNGKPYGPSYTPGSPLQTYKAGDAHLLLGKRHTGGGNPWLTGAIRQAALYDRALSSDEVAAAYRSGGRIVPEDQILAHLSPAQRVLRDRALSRRQKAQEEWYEVGRFTAPVVYAGKREQPLPTRILKRGDVKSPGDLVAPGGLAMVRGINPDFGLSPEAPEAQRRVKFAQWISDRQNPLPARVMANRLWQFHFGQALVATPSDLGMSGSRPSHPLLLDWLAQELIDSGWSLKSLHRRILTSQTYRQSARFRADAAARDADNQWFWRYPPRRLEAEAVRDAMLSVSGQLNLQLGGPSFRPFTTSEYGATFYHLFDKGDPEYNRRTVYRMNINSGKEPLLDSLDCPDPSVKTPRRGVTTTPLQALGLMNSSFVQRQAAELARRALQLSDHQLPHAVESVYRLALGRPATANERQQAEVAARDRGLEHVCWVLLNSTEFVYVR